MYTGLMAATRETKQTDGRGRISLGAGFANRTFLVEEAGDCVVIRPARVIPEDEAWLYANKEALEEVREGLAQARRGEVVKGPSLEKARRLAAKMMGE